MAELLQSVSIRGRYFWVGTERFMIKGIVYQDHKKPYKSRHQDPIADDCLDDLKRDIELLKELGLNTIFVFEIDNTKPHDAAMRLLAEAGIYVLVVLSTPRKYQCIKRAAPYESYQFPLMQHYFKTIDCMAAYSNTLGVIPANEVINSQPSTIAAPVVRAVTRDVKRYMALAHGISGQRQLPVGYSSADVIMYLRQSFDYFTAGDPDEALDFFCFNCYSWSGKASMSISGYDRLVERFSDAHVPVFFSEYGANTIRPRIFQETSAIYSTEMTHVFSGGIVYELWYGTNEYGIVKWRKDEDGKETQELVRMNDFMSLKKRLRLSTDDPNTDAAWTDSASTLAKAPDFPARSSSWMADTTMPESPVDWEGVREMLEMRDWIDVGKEMQESMIDSLVDALSSRLKIHDHLTSTTPMTTPKPPDKHIDPREPIHEEDEDEGCRKFD